MFTDTLTIFGAIVLALVVILVLLLNSSHIASRDVAANCRRAFTRFVIIPFPPNGNFASSEYTSTLEASDYSAFRLSVISVAH